MLDALMDKELEPLYRTTRMMNIPKLICPVLASSSLTIATRIEQYFIVLLEIKRLPDD
jgi:hypothetical protein